MSGLAVDLFMVFQFIKRLTTPFDETDAYRLGIIDERGKKLKSPKSREEKASYRAFDRLVFNLKKLLEKVPGGRSKLATYAAALILIKEENGGYPQIDVDDEKYLYESILDRIEFLSENDFEMVNQISEGINLLTEDAPANAVGSGNISGAGPNDDPPKKRTSNNSIRTTKVIKRFKDHRADRIDELKIVKPSKTLGVPRHKMPQILSKYYGEYKKHLNSNGVTVTTRRINAKDLKPIQKEFHDEKIVSSMFRSLDGEAEKPLITSSDNYIIDGHHRWLAAKNKNPNLPLLVWQASVNIDELLDLTKNFKHTTYKKLKEEVSFFTEELSEFDFKEIEKFADRIFAKFKIDVEFTKHFKERANDPRNKTPITKEEMMEFFQKAFKKYGGKIRQLGKDAEAVLNQITTDINLPFVLNFNERTGELEMTAKTIMRKKDFKSPDDKLKFK